MAHSNFSFILIDQPDEKMNVGLTTVSLGNGTGSVASVSNRNVIKKTEQTESSMLFKRNIVLKKSQMCHNNSIVGSLSEFWPFIIQNMLTVGQHTALEMNSKGLEYIKNILIILSSHAAGVHSG